MDRYQVVYYQRANGDCPVEDYLLSIDTKLSAKVYRFLELISEFGSELREPYSKHLDDGIFELRVSLATTYVRILYFYSGSRCVILTNGFTKKKQKTPINEIARAKAYRKDYLERSGENENS
ncbi:MAG: type II toxin-antitoxin system RelE/ParE family toxin [Symbiobacteriaceae bacterium]|nr:type II toxin-antitoxin system RelE/ParE family toxin [Symbiobacteriaceae bacterium]